MTKHTVEIQKTPVHGNPDMEHCWAPIVNGKVVELAGSPPVSIKAAKIAAAKALGVPMHAIEFKVNG